MRLVGIERFLDQRREQRVPLLERRVERADQMALVADADEGGEAGIEREKLGG